MDKKRFERLKAIVNVDYKNRYDTPNMYFSWDDLKWLVGMAEICPIADFPIVDSLKAEKQLMMEQIVEQQREIAMQESLIDQKSNLIEIMEKEIGELKDCLKTYTDEEIEKGIRKK